MLTPSLKVARVQTAEIRTVLGEDDTAETRRIGELGIVWVFATACFHRREDIEATEAQRFSDGAIDALVKIDWRGSHQSSATFAWMYRSISAVCAA